MELKPSISNLDPSSFPLLQHHFSNHGHGHGHNHGHDHGLGHGHGHNHGLPYPAEGSQSGSRRSSPVPNQGQNQNQNQNQTRPGPYPFHNPTLHNQFDLFHPGSGTSTPITSGSEGDFDHDRDHDRGDGEGEGDGEDRDGDGDGEPRRSGRAGNRRRQKYSRTRTGCLCCRSRRIKCDEARPVCKRCIIAKKTCQWPTSEPEPPKKKKDGRKRIRSSEGRSGSPEERKPKMAANNDLGLYDYGNPPFGQSSTSTSASAATLNGLPGPSAMYPGMPTVGDIPQGDFTWDQSYVGSYDPATASTFASLINNVTGGGGGSGDEISGTVEGPQPVPGGGGSGTAMSVSASASASASDVLGGIMEQKKWGSRGGAPMFNTPNFLLPWFPTAEERSLILHYCANAADLMMAIPSGLNPMLAINLPLALDSPRGVNPSADALRVALLGIGAIHQAFLLARSGVSTAQTATMFQYASNLRDSGKEMVRRATADGTGAGSDAALGAGTALATIDIFFGGGGWMDNFKLAKEMIAYRGGPAEMLKVSKPRQLAEGVTMSPARLMLEILAIYETFGCLTTGQEPSLISDKWESWWFEGGRSSYEEHSVEKQFGMSRVMVHLFSRLTRLIARVSRFHRPISESDLEPPKTPFPPSSTSNKSDGHATPTPINRPEPTHAVIMEARALNGDVDAWIESLQLATLEHERVQVGNRAYAYAMKILLLRMVFGYAREDIKVQNAALEVLTHCSTSTALLGMSIDLTWPAIIAGCCVQGTDRRQWLMTLLEGFKAQCCFDIDTASRIITEVWRRVDAGEGRADWKPVCEDLDLRVLLC